MAKKPSNTDESSSTSSANSAEGATSLSKNLFTQRHEQHKKIEESTIISAIAAKLNVKINDLIEVSQLPDGKGINTKWLKEDLEKNKGNGIRNKIQDLQQGTEKKEEKEITSNPMREDSFVAQMRKREAATHNRNDRQP